MAHSQLAVTPSMRILRPAAPCPMAAVRAARACASPDRRTEARRDGTRSPPPIVGEAWRSRVRAGEPPVRASLSLANRIGTAVGAGPAAPAGGSQRRQPRSETLRESLPNHVPAAAPSAGGLEPPALAPDDPIRPQDLGGQLNPPSTSSLGNRIDQTVGVADHAGVTEGQRVSASLKRSSTRPRLAELVETPCQRAHVKVSTSSTNESQRFLRSQPTTGSTLKALRRAHS